MSLRSLEIWMEPGDKEPSLEPLTALEELCELRLTRYKKLVGLAGLTRLASLDLYGASLANLAGRRLEWDTLRWLRLAVCTWSDFALPRLPSLTYAEIYSPRGRPRPSQYLDPVLASPALEFLFLENVHELQALPDLSACTALKRIHLGNVYELSSLAEALAAPALAVVLLHPFVRLSDHEWDLLLNHPTLEEFLSNVPRGVRRAALEQRFGTNERELPYRYFWS